MRKLALLLIFLVSSAHADLIVRNDRGDSLRLGGSACTNETVLALLKPEWRDKFKGGEAKVRGQRFDACWIEDGGVVTVFYEDGDAAQYPLAAFKDEPGV